MTKKNIIRVACVIGLLVVWAGYVRWNAAHSRNIPSEIQATCAMKLRQIGLAFLVWSGDNENRFPFQVSTNSGGSMEFCNADATGHDVNAPAHFQVMSNELVTPKLLVCPRDTGRTAAADFNELRAEHVSYHLFTGKDRTPQYTNAILLECSLDGNKLLCNGAVLGETDVPARSDGKIPMQIPAR